MSMNCALAATPSTVGELRTLLATAPAETRLFDDFGQPPLIVVHFDESANIEMIELGVEQP